MPDAERLRPVEEPAVGAVGRQLDHDPGAPVGEGGRVGEVAGRGDVIAAPQRRLGRLLVEPERVVAGLAVRRHLGRPVQHVARHRRVLGERGRLLVAVLRLARPAPPVGQHRQQRGQLGRRGPPGRGRTRGAGPGQRGPQVVDHPVDRSPPGVVDVVVARVEGAGGGDAPGQVAGPGGVGLGPAHGVHGVLAHHLQHPVAGLAGRAHGDQQALVDQAGQGVGHRRGVGGLALGLVAGVVLGAGAGDHVDGRRGGERGGEGRHPAQDGPVLGRRQVVGPVERGPQRPVALVGPAPPGQHPQAVAEPGLQPVEADRRQPGGGQLDGERHAVERPADARHPRPVVGRIEGHAHGGGPGQEQGHGVARRLDLVDRQARHRERALEGQHEADAAGGQHGEPGAPGEQALDQGRHPVDQMLAVVEDQQAGRRPDAGGDRLLQRLARDLAHAERGGDGGGEEAVTIAGPVTGTRSTYQTRPENRSTTSPATASASRVLPTPPGPRAVTSRASVTACASAARSAARPTNGVSGAGSGAAVAGGSPGAGPVGAAGPEPSGSAAPASRASERRSSAPSFRSNDDTWLSTVRTEMKRPRRDLGVGQVLADRGQHLRLAARRCLCRRDRRTPPRPRFCLAGGRRPRAVTAT